jgi:hypothetical protein
MKKNKQMSWEILCAVSLGIVLIANTLSVLGLFGLTAPKKISDGLNVYLVPSSYAFMIWPVIYGFQIVMITLSFVFPSAYMTKIGAAAMTTNTALPANTGPI